MVLVLCLVRKANRPNRPKYNDKQVSVTKRCFTKLGEIPKEVFAKSHFCDAVIQFQRILYCMDIAKLQPNKNVFGKFPKSNVWTYIG